MTYNPFSLKNKIILVTGASSGIGKSIAVECAKMGATLIVTGRDKSRLNETFVMLEGTDHLQFIADLNSDQDIQSLTEHIPAIDGLVHSAGISGHKPFSFLKETEIKDMFSVNFFAPAKLTIGLLRAKRINKEASIVFVTSVSGILTSYFGGSLYSSTKGAINGLIKGMALDLSPKKIRVNGVMPAMIETAILENGNLTDEQFESDRKKYPLGRYGRPEEVAYAAIYLLSDASSWTTGTNILLDGGKTTSYS
ncbi:MAG: SDR family oxidoreductase [Mucilaginibacter polytrichastri]|nr:SDR family oxidoreductase [Mucilaginibacter polytrichastri]